MGLAARLFTSASPRRRAPWYDLAPPSERGCTAGWFRLMVGLAAIPAGLLLRRAVTFYGVKLAFLVSATLAAVACAGFWRVR